LTTVLVYSLFVLATVAAVSFNGEGIACRDAECGAVSKWLGEAAPWPMIAAIVISVASGAAVAAVLRER